MNVSHAIAGRSQVASESRHLPSSRPSQAQLWKIINNNICFFFLNLFENTCDLFQLIYLIYL